MKIIKFTLGNFKQKFIQFIPYLISIIFIVALVLTISQSNKMIIERSVLMEQKKQLSNEKMVIVEQKKKLEEKFEIEIKKNRELATEISQSKKDFETLNKKYNEKINGVDYFTFLELQLFFSKRYDQKSGDTE